MVEKQEFISLEVIAQALTEITSGCDGLDIYGSSLIMIQSVKRDVPRFISLDENDHPTKIELTKQSIFHYPVLEGLQSLIPPAYTPKQRFLGFKKESYQTTRDVWTKFPDGIMGMRLFSNGYSDRITMHSKGQEPVEYASSILYTVCHRIAKNTGTKFNSDPHNTGVFYAEFPEKITSELIVEEFKKIREATKRAKRAAAYLNRKKDAFIEKAIKYAMVE